MQNRPFFFFKKTEKNLTFTGIGQNSRGRLGHVHRLKENRVNIPDN